MGHLEEDARGTASFQLPEFERTRGPREADIERKGSIEIHKFQKVGQKTVDFGGEREPLEDARAEGSA